MQQKSGQVVLASKRRMKFTPAEDVQLIELVKKHGEDYRQVQKDMTHFSIRQLRDRFNNYLREELNTSLWTLEENAKLMKLYNQMGPNWTEMTKQFHKRSAVNIKNHFATMMNQMSRLKVRPDIQLQVPLIPEPLTPHLEKAPEILVKTTTSNGPVNKVWLPSILELVGNAQFVQQW